MRVSIFGLGYVGAVSAGCLANDGHSVTGVDPNEAKVNLVNQGMSPIIEKDIGDLIDKGVRAGRLHATHSSAEAVDETAISLVCVGTPSNGNGSLDLSYVRSVCKELGQALAEKPDFHTVVMRSTVLPGTMRNVVIPVLEEYSGKKAGHDFGICNNPEFLREGSAVYDYYHPPKIVVGESDRESGSRLLSLYESISAPVVRTDVETAEMVKYVDNMWHALKVCFANEVGNICKSLYLDGYEVMDIFCKDTKLNLSSYYLKPGFAFGGSCLPKDVRAMKYKARMLDVEVPVLDSILQSNERQVERGIAMVRAHPGKRLGILGMSFKEGTDDLRESPMVELIERLIGKGYDIRIYDKNVSIASLTGANKDYILNRIPHISRFLVTDIGQVIEHADTIVVGTGDPEFARAGEYLHSGQAIVDFARISGLEGVQGVDYDGICW